MNIFFVEKQCIGPFASSTIFIHLHVSRVVSGGLWDARCPIDAFPTGVISAQFQNLSKNKGAPK